MGFCIIFVHYATRYAYGILLPEMLPSLNISNLEAGVIYTAYFASYTLITPFLGIMADKFDARKIIALFLVILGVGTFLMGLSKTLVEASLFFALSGIGCAACWVPIVTVTQRWFKKKALAVAIINIGAPLGFAIDGVIMPFIIRAGGWRLGWRLLSALSFLLAPISWISIKSFPENHPPERGSVKASKSSFKREIFEIIRDLRFWLISISYMLVGFYIMIPFTFLSTYASQEIALPYAYSTALLSIIAMGAIPGMLSLSTLSESIGRFKVLILCGIISIIGLIGKALSSDFLHLAISAIIYGVAYGPIWALYAAYISDVFSMERAGMVLGLVSILFGAGCLLSPPLAGWMADTTHTYRLSFIAAAAGAALSTLFLLPMRKSKFHSKT
ncbi:MAG: MFS transporter [Candidatus Bathyarchaeia archaeon]